MHQYLLNSSGDFARETPDVFRRIGAAEPAHILDEANAFFGPNGPPTDRETRMAALLALPNNAEDRIYALSKVFYNAEDCGLSLADLFDAYVCRKHECLCGNFCMCRCNPRRCPVAWLQREPDLPNDDPMKAVIAFHGTFDLVPK